MFENLRNLPFAPSAQMRSVPSKTIGQVLGITDGGDEEPEDEIDQRIKSESTILTPSLPQTTFARNLTVISDFV